MLEGLDEVDWSRLEHAYGPASDVPDLIRDVLSDDAEVRERAWQGLFSTIWHQGTVYEATAHAVPFLLELLAAPDVPDKGAIFQLLSCIAEGSSYIEVHAPLFDRHRSPTPDERERRESVLSRERDWVRAARRAVEDGVRVYLDLLDDEDPGIRESAASILDVCASRASWLIPELADRVAGRAAPRDRAALIMAMGRLAADSGETDRAVRLFEERMRPGEEPVVRLAAAVSLARATPGGATAEVIETLHAVAAVAWRDFEGVAGDAAGPILEAIGESPEARWRLLAGLLDHPDPEVRSSARFAANRLCHERRSITPAIAAAFGERLLASGVEDRRSIVRLLWGLGLGAAPAAGPLAVALGDDDTEVRSFAAVATAALGDPRAIPVIIDRLRHRDFPWLASSLGGFGDGARDAVPTLLDLLRGPPIKTDSIVDPRIAIIAALGRIGPGAAPAIPTLLDLSATGPQLRFTVAEAVGRIGGPGARAAIPLLESWLDDPDETVRVNAARALWRIDGRTAPVLPVLIGAVRARRVGRSPAAEALGEMGEAAREAVPDLVARLEDRSSRASWPRIEAAIALRRIERRADRTLPVLLDVLRDPDIGAPIATRAAEALGEPGAEAREAVPILRAFDAADVRPFGHHFRYSSHFVIEDEAFRAAVAEALRRIEGEGA